jgi:twitching motility protein PilT
MLDMDGSDLHLAVGMPPRVRASGSIMDMEDEPELDQQSLEEMLQEICNETRWNHFQENYDPDLAHEIPGLARFRGSFLYNQWWSGAVFRQIPAEILSFDKLNLPEILKEVYGYQEGLVLVTGPTGSGKSTTMAAMLDYINDNYQKHIITIEDPIEFVNPKKTV